MSASSNERPAPPTLLQQFRTKSSRQKIHPRERLLLITVCAQLVMLPWALGAMRLEAQIASLVLGLVNLTLALLPRHYDEPAPGQTPFKLYTWPKLIRFPIFWLGLTLFALIVVQALNPAWEFATNGKSWWMLARPHVAWLPSGVSVPFERWGPWRSLMIYGSAWVLVCAMWIGFTRRRTYQAMFSVLAASAFLLAALGIAQRALGATKIFWLWQPPAHYFVSSFTYKNHAGAYFNLMLALCAGLAFWHYERSTRRLDKSGPSGIFAFFGTAVAMIVVFSYSRTATVLLFSFLLVVFAVFLWRMFIRARPGERNPLMLFIVMTAFAAFIGIALISLRTDRFVLGMNQISDQIETLNGRTITAKATWEMASDRPIAGWGAGSFRFRFPTYQRHHPEIYMEHGQRLYWEHAHNDYAELFAEFGFVGVALALAALGFCGWRLLQLHAWQNPLALFVCLGCLVTLAHCYLDFNFFNPAILTTWLVLLFGTIRWLELEEQASGG